jgi:hypothetical protein
VNSPPVFAVWARRGARVLSSVLAGVEGEKVMNHPCGFGVRRLAFAPGSSGPPTAGADEAARVRDGDRRGSSATGGESREVLHAGDAMLIETKSLSAWRNPGQRWPARPGSFTRSAEGTRDENRALEQLGVRLPQKHARRKQALACDYAFGSRRACFGRGNLRRLARVRLPVQR